MLGHEASHGSSLRVLLIEDDDEHAFIVDKAFGKHLPTATVERAINADGALNAVRENRFDIILLDHSLPGATGMELLHTLNSEDVEAPIIMFTSSEGRELVVEALQAGAYDYVVKTAESLFYIPIIAQRAVEKYGIERDQQLLKEQLLEARTDAVKNFEQVSERNRELKETQKELSDAYDRLLEMNRMKSVFMANVSHELRTPLNAIMGYTSLLLDSTYGQLSKKQADCLRRVDRRANDLLRQINDILDFSKFETNRMPLFIEAFAFLEVVEEAERKVRPLTQGAAFEFRTELDEVPTMQSDRQKIRRVLVHLLTNAIKFTETGHVLLKVSHDQDSQSVIVLVEDTGIGIESGDIKSIFTEFHQLDGSSTRQFGGTGLGLSIVKKMVELLGGHVDVSSEPGQGSRFQVRLPILLGPPSVLPASEPPPPDPARQRPERDGLTLLSVDDDQDVIRLVEESLAPEGYSVISARTGGEAIEMAIFNRPDAILLDVALPDMMGWDVLRQLKQNPDTRSTPVIIMSAVDNKELGYSLGAEDYLVKPVDKEQWIASILKVRKSGSSA